MPSETVFVTGATGFIGSHVVEHTLKAGYRVRLSVRRPEQVDELKQRWAANAQNLEFSIVPDITVPGAFDEALEGIKYIFHLASPLPGKGSDLRRDYVEPAVEGTRSILESALSKPSIKTVLVTSSVVALLPVFASTNINVKDNTGEDNPADLDMDIPEGPRADFIKYRLSKITAHAFTKEFLKQRKPHYKLITFHPTAVLGHSLTQKTADGIEGMNKPWWLSLEQEKPVIFSAWVSVHDVAEAHIKAIDTDIPTGTEILLNGRQVDWELIITYLKSTFPKLPIKLQGPFDGDFEKPWNVDTSTADKYLGIKWKTLELITGEIVAQQLAFAQS